MDSHELVNTASPYDLPSKSPISDDSGIANVSIQEENSSLLSRLQTMLLRQTDDPIENKMATFADTECIKPVETNGDSCIEISDDEELGVIEIVPRIMRHNLHRRENAISEPQTRGTNTSYISGIKQERKVLLETGRCKSATSFMSVASETSILDLEPPNGVMSQAHIGSNNIFMNATKPLSTSLKSNTKSEAKHRKAKKRSLSSDLENGKKFKPDINLERWPGESLKEFVDRKVKALLNQAVIQTQHEKSSNHSPDTLKQEKAIESSQDQSTMQQEQMVKYTTKSKDQHPVIAPDNPSTQFHRLQIEHDKSINTDLKISQKEVPSKKIVSSIDPIKALHRMKDFISKNCMDTLTQHTKQGMNKQKSLPSPQSLPVSDIASLSVSSKYNTGDANKPNEYESNVFPKKDCLQKIGRPPPPYPYERLSEHRQKAEHHQTNSSKNSNKPDVVFLPGDGSNCSPLGIPESMSYLQPTLSLTQTNFVRVPSGNQQNQQLRHNDKNTQMEGNVQVVDPLRKSTVMQNNSQTTPLGSYNKPTAQVCQQKPNSQIGYLSTKHHIQHQLHPASQFLQQSTIPEIQSQLQPTNQLWNKLPTAQVQHRLQSTTHLLHQLPSKTAHQLQHQLPPICALPMPETPHQLPTMHDGRQQLAQPKERPELPTTTLSTFPRVQSTMPQLRHQLPATSQLKCQPPALSSFTQVGSQPLVTNDAVYHRLTMSEAQHQPTNMSQLSYKALSTYRQKCAPISPKNAQNDIFQQGNQQQVLNNNSLEYSLPDKRNMDTLTGQVYHQAGESYNPDSRFSATNHIPTIR